MSSSRRRRRSRSPTTFAPRRVGATEPLSARATSSSPTRRAIPPGSSYTRFTRPALAEVGSVRPLDARTVRVVLRSRFGGWRLLFPYVLPAHALAGADFATVWNDGFDDPRTGRPIGSGPFLVRRWERGREITFERNPRYWEADSRISTGSCSGSRSASRSDRGAAARRARSRPRHPVLGRRGPGGSAAGPGGPRAVGGPGGLAGSTSRSVSRLRVTRLCATSSCGGRSRMRSTEPALARAVLGEAGTR